MTTSTPSDKYFLWFSDFHFDPYYATKDAYKASYNAKAVCNSPLIPSLGSVGCDSSRALVYSALEHATEIAASPSFIIVSGDMVRHGVDMLYTSSNQEGSENRDGNEVELAAHSDYHNDAMNEVGEILYDVFGMVSEVFPDVEIIFSMGNNDVVPDYYLQLEDEPPTMTNSSMTPEESGMLGIIYNALRDNSEVISESNQIGAQRRGLGLLSVEDSSTFLKGGYYSRVLSNGLTILSINSVLYSSFFSPEPRNAEDPGDQFAWMRNTLSNIRENGNSKAMIVGHIPPGVGSYRHRQLWKEKYIKAYYDIIQDFDDVIAGHLGGHLHSDEFRIGADSISTPLLLAGSLTPIHGNNPSFRKVLYGGDDDGQFRLLDYESHYHSMDDINPTWSKLYTFSETYVDAGEASQLIKTEGLSANVFRSILQSMEDGQGEMSPTLESFLSFVKSGSEESVDCDANCRNEWMCTLSVTTTAVEYKTCLFQKWHSRAILGVAGAALFSAAFIVVLAVRCSKSRRRAHYETTSSVEGNEEVEDQMI